VPIGKKVPPQAARRHFARSNAMGKFALEAAAARKHAAKVLVVLHQAQAAPAANVEFRHLPRRHSVP
jgi:hypothetical protein